MAGGSIGLASGSASGLDLTNVKPQITYFRKVYKRHTNFGIDHFQQNTNATIAFGSEITINVQNRGSLITDMHMEFTLPPVAGTGGKTADGKRRFTDKRAATGTGSNIQNIGIVQNWVDYAHWVESVGFAIIDNVKLLIDKVLIDTHTGLWYDIWNELTDINRKEYPLIGKYNNSIVKNKFVTQPKKIYIPLKFFFNRNPGLALPLFVLGENKVSIKIKFKSLKSLLNFKTGTNTIINDKNITNFKFFTTYIFLEAEEQQRINKTLPAEYLIETIEETIITSSSGLNNIIYTNPIKELIWVFRHKNRLLEPILDGSNKVIGNIPAFNDSSKLITTNSNDIFNYSSVEKRFNNSYETYDTFETLTLKIRNNNRFEETDSIFFRVMQPYKHHSRIPGGVEEIDKKKYVYVYSFAINPEEYQPSGSFNPGIKNDKLMFTFNSIDFTNYQMNLFALKYEYLSINTGKASLSTVPTQTINDSIKSNISPETKSDSSGSSGSSKKDETIISEKQKEAVEQEIKKRYIKEVPHLHSHEHQHLHKKKWSGLQGNIFGKIKENDLK